MKAYIKKYSLSVLIVFLLLLTGVTGGYAQVQIAPVALYMNEDNKTGRVVVRNSTNKPVELSIELFFGYPDTDENGKIFLNLPDKTSESQPSAKDWVRVYPRHLVLPPNEQQTIRFAARPPADLPPGEYWLRPAISSQDVEKSGKNGENKISAHINLIKRTFLSLNYRNGRVNTGISIQNMEAEKVGENLNVYAQLQRKGNAAYLGHYDVRIFDASNNLKKHQRKELAVYHNQRRKLELDTENLEPGNYRVELTLSTRERTQKKNAILSAPTVSKEIDITLK